MNFNPIFTQRLNNCFLLTESALNLRPIGGQRLALAVRIEQFFETHAEDIFTSGTVDRELEEARSGDRRHEKQ